jgi:extradiol dioxygenase family protein
MKSLFHIAVNVTDIELACEFYEGVLGCHRSRQAETWVDFDFFGHQLSLHLGEPLQSKKTGIVDNIAVPMPHFGVVLPLETWQKLADKLIAQQLSFVIKPCLRFAGLAAEQHTMFFYDPFGNPIEVKGFADLSKVFD